MSIKALKKALEKKVTDQFEVATVIRWVSSERYNYAAIKTPVGWYTTAADYNTHVPQILKFEDLVDVLSRSESSNIEVATDWEPVR